MLKPGGRLLISDYCRAPGAPTPAFAEYIKQRGYDLHSVDEYGAMLERAGFQAVKAEDRTWQVQSKPSFTSSWLLGCYSWCFPHGRFHVSCEGSGKVVILVSEQSRRGQGHIH